MSSRNTIVGVKAVLERFAVLVRGVVAQHLTVGGALEGLEASLAFDGEGRSILYDLVSTPTKGRAAVKNYIQISAGSSPRLFRLSRPRARASAGPWDSMSV